MKTVLSVLLSLLLWALLSGSSFFVSCSSGGGDDDDIIPGINDAPVASNSSFVTTVNQPVSDFLQASDSNGDNLVFRIVSGPSLGFVQIDNAFTGAFTYISGTAGVDTFTFRANDDLADSNTAIVTLTVNRVPLIWESTLAGNEPGEVLSLEALLDELGYAHRVRGIPVSAPTAELQADATNPFSRVTSDPFNPSHQLAISKDGKPQQSRDGGHSWDTIDLSSFAAGESVAAALAFSEFVPDLIYIVLDPGAGGSRLIRSTDGGNTWLLISDDSRIQILELAVGPLSAAGSVTLYARIEGEQNIHQAVDYPY